MDSCSRQLISIKASSNQGNVVQHAPSTLGCGLFTVHDKKTQKYEQPMKFSPEIWYWIATKIAFITEVFLMFVKFGLPTKRNAYTGGLNQNRSGNCSYQKSFTKTIMHEVTLNSTHRRNFCCCLRATNAIQFLILLEFLFFTFATCLSQTSTYGQEVCYPGCICVYGENSIEITSVLFKENRQRDAWTRLNRKSKPTGLLLFVECSHSKHTSIPNDLRSDTVALVADYNDVTSLKSLNFTLSKANPNETASLVSTILMLSISSNKISIISPTFFESLGNLEILHLRDNLIFDLEWTFNASGLYPNLTELDLSRNKLNRLDAGTIGTFPRLLRLDLSNNDIASISDNFLQKFPKLEYLNLSSNRLKTSSFSTTVTSSLRHLFLSNNSIDDIGKLNEQFFKKLLFLQQLDLSRNPLSNTIVGSELFKGFRSLTSLNLSHCGITSLRQGWLNGGLQDTLEILDLSYNHLSTISAHQLSSVFTAGLSVTTLPPMSNLLRDVTPIVTLSSTSSDTNLDFSRVPTELVDVKWLRPLLKLHTLYLSGNRMFSFILDDTFDYVPSLRYLFLQNCALRKLNIASVRFRYGEQAIARTLPSLTNIWVFGNPLNCDCYVRKLKEWERDSTNMALDSTRYNESDGHTVFVHVSSSMCVSPSRYAEVTVASADESGLTCPEEPYSIFIALLIGPLTFAASILLIILCGSIHVSIVRMRRETVLSYHLREEKMRQLRRMHEPNRHHNRHHHHHHHHQPDPILSSFQWSRPSPKEESHVKYNAGHRAPRHTNLVMDSFASNEHSQYHHHHSPPHHHPSSQQNFLSVPGMASGHSGTSLDTVDHHSSSRHSVGYCSGTDNQGSHNNKVVTPVLIINDVEDYEKNSNRRDSRSDVDSVFSKESVMTRSLSGNIPYIDESKPYPAASKVSYHSKLFSSSSSSSNRSDDALLKRSASAAWVNRQSTVAPASLERGSRDIGHFSGITRSASYQGRGKSTMRNRNRGLPGPSTLPSDYNEETTF